jgi:hypothetical protein
MVTGGTLNVVLTPIYIHGYPLHLEAVSSVHNMRMCHALVTKDPLKMACRRLVYLMMMDLKSGSMYFNMGEGRRATASKLAV